MIATLLPLALLAAILALLLLGAALERALLLMRLRRWQEQPRDEDSRRDRTWAAVQARKEIFRTRIWI